MKLKNVVATVLICGLSAGCATIVGEETQLIPIGSTPDEANIVIRDETGAQVFKGMTPTTVNLQKSDGTFSGAARVLLWKSAKMDMHRN